MSAKITTPFGHNPNSTSRHSVVVHMPSWDVAEKFGRQVTRGQVIDSLKTSYPRMKPHRDIAGLLSAVLKYLNLDSEVHTGFILATLHTAQEFVEFATSPRRDDGAGKKPVKPDQITIRAFRAKDLFYVVLFPKRTYPAVINYWLLAGVGVSSRFGEANLAVADQLSEVPLSQAVQSKTIFDGPAHQIVRKRIIHCLERAPLHPEIQLRPSPDDVYLFPSGMASIMRPHMWMSSIWQGTTAIFGMAFVHTLMGYDTFGAGYKFFAHGTNDDIRALEIWLDQETNAGRRVQAILVEFPANPHAFAADLFRLRALADQYDVVLIIDDTIGSYSNIDVMHLADIQNTSLTKSFNGNADVIAGCAILNPASRKYAELKPLFTKNYVQELYVAEAEAIEHNSRNYLERSTILNNNTLAVASYLHSCAEDPDSAVHKVYYQPYNESGHHYRGLMRPATPEFTPGYGCLFTVEFEDLPTTIAYYENLNVHIGPHLGAPMTLMFAYTVCQFGDRLDWAAQHGLLPTQLRMAIGMEDIDVLMAEFRIAVAAADKVKRENAAAKVAKATANASMNGVRS